MWKSKALLRLIQEILPFNNGRGHFLKIQLTSLSLGFNDYHYEYAILAPRIVLTFSIFTLIYSLEAKTNNDGSNVGVKCWHLSPVLKGCLS